MMSALRGNEVYEEELDDYGEEDEEALNDTDFKRTGGSANKVYAGIHSSGFRVFLLKPELLRAITDLGLEHPSQVQHECIPQAILGMDVICQAKFGMGKTAVFVLSTLQQIEPISGQIGGLVLCHTRELTHQMWRDVNQIFKMTPHDKQVMMFSATLTKELRPVFKKLMRDPLEIYLDDESKLTLHGLVQHYIKLTKVEKNRKLNDILDALDFNQVVIFVNTIDTASELNKLLLDCNFPSICIRSGMSQEERLARYKDFKEGVATDLIRRGIDIERVSIVINYDMSDSADAYLHRVGRAGRFGTKGLAITFVSFFRDSSILNQVQKRFQMDIKELPEQIDSTTYGMSSELRSVVSYFGEFKKSDQDGWTWSGKETKSLVVSRNISYTELYDRVRELPAVDSTSCNVEMRFPIPGMTCMPVAPVKVTCNDDVKWPLSVHQQISLCIPIVN